MVSQISVSFLIVFIVIQWKIAGLEAPKLFVLAERLGDLSKAKAPYKRSLGGTFCMDLEGRRVWRGRRRDKQISARQCSRLPGGS